MNRIKLIVLELEKYHHMIKLRDITYGIHELIEENMLDNNRENLCNIESFISSEKKDIKDKIIDLLRELMHEMNNEEDLNEAKYYFGWNQNGVDNVENY